VSTLVTVPLADVVAATPRSRILSLDLGDTSFAFVAGQAVIVGEHGQTDRRPYSIASSPERAHETRRLELLIGLDAAGSIGPHLLSLMPRTLIDLEGPVGAFMFPDAPSERRLLFVAGGTGIAPLRAMLDHTLRRHPSEQISLLYSARRADEFAFIEELRDHADAGRIELHQTVTREDESWEGGRGRIGRSHFEAVLHEPKRTLCFVCGPPAMVSESVETLAELGVPRELIRREQWQT
jgi:NAD(P)H-flavin reductase